MRYRVHNTFWAIYNFGRILHCFILKEDDHVIFQRWTPGKRRITFSKWWLRYFLCIQFAQQIQDLKILKTAKCLECVRCFTVCIYYKSDETSCGIFFYQWTWSICVKKNHLILWLDSEMVGLRQHSHLSSTQVRNGRGIMFVPYRINSADRDRCSNYIHGKWARSTVSFV